MICVLRYDTLTYEESFHKTPIAGAIRQAANFHYGAVQFSLDPSQRSPPHHLAPDTHEEGLRVQQQ